MLLSKQYFQDSHIQNSNGVLKANCEYQIPQEFLTKILTHVL